jgi:hypothetical protein
MPCKSRSVERKLSWYDYNEGTQAAMITREKSILERIGKIATVVLSAALVTFLLGGCSQSAPRTKDSVLSVQREDPITDTGRQRAVLSLHVRTEPSSGCLYGLTLTNNLPVEIRDLPLRFSAYGELDVPLQSVTRGFVSVRPTESQFTQINFAFACRNIRRIEVGAFDRCIVGDLTRRSADASSCLNLVDIPQSQFVELIKADTN